MKKRILVLALALCMALTLLPFGVSAAMIVESGSCGDNVSYTLDADGLLTIRGNGWMETIPWASDPFSSTYADSARIKSVVIEPGVQNVHGGAFYACVNLTSVSLPDGLREIGRGAFDGCSSLESLIIPSSVRNIEELAFRSCTKLERIAIPDKVTRINDFTFQNCRSLYFVVLPKGTTSIGSFAFENCTALTEIIIPDKVTSIGGDAFRGCSGLRSISIPDSVTEIGPIAFAGCSGLTSVTFPSGLTSIEEGTFSDCTGLTSMTIPMSITELGQGAFSGCTGLKSIAIPATVKRVAGYAFDHDDALENVYYTGTQSQWKAIDIGERNDPLQRAKLHPSIVYPEITTQPKNAGVIDNGSVQYTVKASGTGLTYQWQCQMLRTAWTNCTSASKGYNTPTLTVTAVSNGFNRNGYKYRCVVTDARGISVTSNAASLSVLSITHQSKSKTVTAGSRVYFGVDAEGVGLKYQWQYKTPGSTGWDNCTSKTPGYHSEELHFYATASRNGYEYRCKVTDNCGHTVKSAPMTLNVLGITAQPKSTSAAVGGTATFTVKAVGEGLKYRWQYKTPGSTGWDNCTSKTPGYNTATLQFSATASRNGYEYRCKVTDSSGNIVKSDGATLNVLAITAQPKSTSAAVGGTATFTVKAQGDGLRYQWQYKTPGSTGWDNCTSKTPGYNTATLQFSATASRNGYEYRCKVTDSAGNIVKSNAAKLTVH